ncbi:hypothetical protein AALA73_10260 [Parasutterella excrementihominis]|uniref:hypothetical protein n=1 Tax=Parasutterella excrementihominis TaxID=487175 RepID=UPI0035154CF1
MADAVKDLLKRGQAKDAAVLIDETEEKTIDASSAEYEEDGFTSNATTHPKILTN